MINSKRKAVFLDRDGVINLHRDDYVKNLDELKILPNVPKAIKFLNDLGFIIIVVTNQSVINRKIISIDELDILHSTISSKIAKYSGKIECFYYCPHLPSENCICRKPKPGLLLQSIKDFDIDVSSSLLIGDTDIDIESALSAKIKGYKIKRNGDLLDFVHSNITLFKN